MDEYVVNRKQFNINDRLEVVGIECSLQISTFLCLEVFILK